MRPVAPLLAAAALLAALPPLPARAQSPAASSVLVVFQKDLWLDGFRHAYLPDDRARAHPDAWNYLDPGVAGFVQTLEREIGFRADHVYSAALRGFSAHLTDRQIQALAHRPFVAYVEPDGVATVGSDPPQILPWGIDRVDADQSSTIAGDGTGEISNVHAYVIDTGIDVTHPDLNVVQHVNFASRFHGSDPGPNTDCYGHGTFVAGILAARDNAIDVVGVAPGTPLTGVKVLGCTGAGSNSDVVKGVDWVTANAIKPAVANMSLTYAAIKALDDAVQQSVASGIVYAVIAGNSAADACNWTPARTGAGTNNGIMTVAATDEADQETDFSNYGPCVDIWAPGIHIASTTLGGGVSGPTGYGTSFASPHVAGGAALYLSTHPSATPAAVEAALKGAADLPGTKSKDGRDILRENVKTF